jgi:hypothetical protein
VNDKATKIRNGETTGKNQTINRQPKSGKYPAENSQIAVNDAKTQQ